MSTICCDHGWDYLKRNRERSKNRAYRSINGLPVNVSPGLCFLTSTLHNMTTICQQTSCSLMFINPKRGVLLDLHRWWMSKNITTLFCCLVLQMTYDSNMTIHVLDAAVGSRDQKLGLDQLLDSQNDAIIDSETNGGAVKKRNMVVLLTGGK